MTSKDAIGWTRAGFDFWMLGAEAATVMSLRMARLSGGGAASADEAALMVREKVLAAFELQRRFMTGAIALTPLGATEGVLRHYRGKVAANTRRLAS